ncbi:MAG TPA: hypothetical protein VIV60_24540 [Polyangiaceae bacterium]
MSDPIRLVDDPRAPSELRNLLARAPRARALDPTARHRIGRRLARFLALPLVLTVGLTMKTAAAALAVATGGLVVGAVVIHEVQVLRALSVPLPIPSHSATQRQRARAMVERVASDATRRELLERVEMPTPAAAFPDADTAVSNPSLASRGSPAAPRKLAAAAPASVQSSIGVQSSGLELEAAMLETARRALATSPAEALAIVGEHRARFPRATLTSERDLIQLDALCRMQRRAEARQLGNLLRARGGLYAERVDRLLEKMDTDE